MRWIDRQSTQQSQPLITGKNGYKNTTLHP